MPQAKLIDSKARLRANPDAKLRLAQTSSVALNVGSGDAWQLNETGTEIWAALEAGLSPDEVAEKISARTGVPKASVLADTIGFVQGLVDAGLFHAE